MTKIAVFAGGELEGVHFDFDILVGVDRGSFFLIEKGIVPDLAVGDFDSVSADELKLIQKKAKECLQVSAEKDDTDLELAVNIVFERYPQAQVTIFGALGGRLDHTLTNVFLPSNEKIAPYMKQITLKDVENQIRYCPAGKNKVYPQEGMKYVAFMPVENVALTIEDAKYSLNKDNFFFKKIYASNEFIDRPISLSFDSGYAVVIYSKDRS